MSELIGEVTAHVLIAVFAGGVGYFVKANLMWLTKLLDPVARSQAKLIRGDWNATERFSDDNFQSDYKLTLACRGAQVSGSQSYKSGGADKNMSFDLTGKFENLTLNFTWTKRDSIETGTVTLRLVNDNRLEGHGLYVIDQKVFTSIFTATKI